MTGLAAMTAGIYREPAQAATWLEGVEGDAATLSFDGVEPPPLGPVARVFVLVWLTLAMLFILALMLARMFLEWAAGGGGFVWGSFIVLVVVGAGLYGFSKRKPAARAARQRARRRATGAPVRYVVRMTSRELSLSADGEPRGKSIALERITGFWGDRQIRVEVRDGAAIRLYCGLPGADYRALAAALERMLTQVRESGAEARP